MTELVNHPKHYTSSDYEAIDVIIRVGSGFLRGSALKYLCRLGQKDSVITELGKVHWYLCRLVTTEEPFKPMAHVEAAAVAAAWAKPHSHEYDVIYFLLTGKLDEDRAPGLPVAISQIKKARDREVSLLSVEVGPLKVEPR
jgi:hypothetical protein